MSAQPSAVKAPLPEWMKTAAALEHIGVNNGDFKGLSALEHRPSTFRGGMGRRPYLYRSADIERIRLLITEAQLSLPAAIRVVVAQNEKRL